MTATTGKIERLYKNKGQFWSIQLSDGVWYSLGKTTGPITEDHVGRTVSFEWFEKENQKTGYKSNEIKLHTIVLAGNMPQTSQDSPRQEQANRVAAKDASDNRAPQSTTGGLSKEGYWDRKDARDLLKDKTICFNGAYNAAVATVQAALAAGVLDINSQVKKSKAEGAEYSVFKTYVLGLAEELYQVFQNVPKNHDVYMGTEALAEPKQSSKDTVHY